MECKKCLSEDVWGGCSMTNYKCCDCGETYIWGNTNTPKRCRKCSEENNKCIYCDNEVN